MCNINHDDGVMKVFCKKDFCLSLYEDSNNDMYRKGEYYELAYEEEKTYCIRFNEYNSVHNFYLFKCQSYQDVLILFGRLL